MSFAQTVVLAAFAGGTIFLGLPVGRLRGLSRGVAGRPDHGRRRRHPLPDLRRPLAGGGAGRAGPLTRLGTAWTLPGSPATQPRSA